MYRLRVYEERTDKYMGYFKHRVSGMRVILDVWSGRGIFSKVLASKKHLVIALDIEEDLLKGIKSPYILSVRADAHYIPLRDGSVDCALAISLLEHLENPKRCVEELYRVLKCDGIAVIQLPNLQYLFEPHTKWPLLGLMPKRLQLRILKMIGYPYINMEVTIKNALSILQKAGFKLEETIKVYHLSIMKLIPIAPAYIFIARKTCKPLENLKWS